jgi:hypothetical protein
MSHSTHHPLGSSDHTVQNKEVWGPGYQDNTFYNNIIGKVMMCLLKQTQLAQLAEFGRSSYLGFPLERNHIHFANYKRNHLPIYSSILHLLSRSHLSVYYAIEKRRGSNTRSESTKT